MKKGAERRKLLAALAALPDSEIDTSDIPELSEEQLSTAVRGQMYRPRKHPVSMRLDADVIAWLKSGGPGYQTKANRILRGAMLRKRSEKPSGRSGRKKAS